MPLITRSRTVVKRGGIVSQCYTVDSQTRESGTNLVLPCRSLDKFVHATLLQYAVFCEWVLGSGGFMWTNFLRAL